MRRIAARLAARLCMDDAATPELREGSARGRSEEALACVDLAHDAPFFLWVQLPRAAPTRS